MSPNQVIGTVSAAEFVVAIGSSTGSWALAGGMILFTNADRVLSLFGMNGTASSWSES